jgi:protein-S-isoprenylcysteine O-methyltransferase Ste14
MSLGIDALRSTTVATDGLLRTAASRDLSAKSTVLHVLECVFVTALFVHFSFRMLSEFDLSGNIVALLLLVSEALPVALIYCRTRSGTISDRPIDWLLAMTGASAPLLTHSSDAPPLANEHLCAALMIGGIFIQISAKVILWRSFGIVAGNRGIKIDGPYRFVRHPMYLGYMVTHVGFLLAFPSFYNTALYSAALAVQIARILREERLLNQDPGYRKFASRVRYRLIPGVF